MMPKVRYGIFECDNIEGLYAPRNRVITLDIINEQRYFKRFMCLTHEVLHHFFNYMPRKFYTLFSKWLDILDSNYDEDDSPVVIIYVFE